MSSASDANEGFHKLFFFGGLTAPEIWPIVNPIMMPSWLLLILFPKWKYTPTITYLLPLIHALMYTLVGMSLLLEDMQEVDFLKLQDIVHAFQDGNICFYGWIHYLCYDVLVARMIVMDSQERGVSNLFHSIVMVPVLILACMFAPTGWLVYNIVIEMREMWLAKRKNDKLE